MTQISTWYYHTQDASYPEDIGFYDETAYVMANKFSIPRNPNAKPITLAMADQALRDLYVPRLLADINRPLLFDKLGIKPVEVTPLPEWRKRWLRTKERFVDSYSHLRRGHCDASYEMEHHDCY